MVTVDIDNDFEHAKLIIGCIEAVTQDLMPDKDFEVTVTIVNNKEMHQLNLTHRGVDATTDCLSFPLMEFDEPYVQNVYVLGDIVLNIEKAQEQSHEYGHSLTREIAFLTVHSCLHLFGYDHMQKEDELIMRNKQSEILDLMGITPYGGTNV